MSWMMLIDDLVPNHRQHAVEMSGKHWAGRVVAAVQILSWCAVSGLLLNKGLTNITNAAKVAEQGREPRGMTSGVVMVATGSFMLLVSPTILLIKFIDARRRRKRMQDSEEDLPPSYEQAMESAPRYSTLFLNAGSEIHEQLLECQNTDNQPAIIPMNNDSRELNSTAHLTHAPQNYVQKLLVPETEKLDGANVT